jgi:hypothetical protein
MHTLCLHAKDWSTAGCTNNSGGELLCASYTGSACTLWQCLHTVAVLAHCGSACTLWQCLHTVAVLAHCGSACTQAVISRRYGGACGILSSHAPFLTRVPGVNTVYAHGPRVAHSDIHLFNHYFFINLVIRLFAPVHLQAACLAPAPVTPYRMTPAPRAPPTSHPVASAQAASSDLRGAPTATQLAGGAPCTPLTSFTTELKSTAYSLCRSPTPGPSLRERACQSLQPWRT